MAYNAEKASQVYEALKKMGFGEGFCKIVSEQMCTDWTATRMLGYLRQVPHLKEEDIVDEMLAIQSDRDRIRQKNEMEYYQSKTNELYRNGLK